MHSESIPDPSTSLTQTPATRRKNSPTLSSPDLANPRGAALHRGGQESTPTTLYQFLQPQPPCAVQLAMKNTMLNCTLLDGDEWRNASQIVYTVTDDPAHNANLSANLSARCMKSHELSTGFTDAGGILQCKLSSFSRLESSMLAQVMRDSSEATGSSGNRSIRSATAVVGLGLASGPLSAVDSKKKEVHIEIDRSQGRPPLKAQLLVADQSGKTDSMPFHIDKAKAVTGDLDDEGNVDLQCINKYGPYCLCICNVCVRVLHVSNSCTSSSYTCISNTHTYSHVLY